MNTFKLEPPNESTIFCDVSLLREIEAAILALDQDDIESLISDLESGEDLEYYDLDFSAEEIEAVASELLQRLKTYCEQYSAVDRYLSDNSKFWIEQIEDPESDFNRDYAYTADESPIDAERLKKYVAEYLGAHVADVSDQLVQDLIDSLVDHEIEIETRSGCFHNEPLFDLACIPWEEYEDQIDVDSLLGVLPGMSIELLPVILAKLSDEYCLRDYENIADQRYPVFYQYIYTDTYVYYGYPFAVIDNLIDLLTEK